MPWYLIGITKARWERDEKAAWLRPPQIPAVVYLDLRPTGNTLSLWHIEDDRSNLKDVITAIAATRSSYANFDYGLFDQNIPPRLSIKLEATEGSTPITHANHWHRDLVELTADKLLALVEAVFDNLEKHRVSVQLIRQYVIDALKMGQVDIPQIKPQLLTDPTFIGIGANSRVITDEVWINAQVREVEEIGVERTLIRLREQIRKHFPAVQATEESDWLVTSVQMILTGRREDYFRQLLDQLHAEFGAAPGAGQAVGLVATTPVAPKTTAEPVAPGGYAFHGGAVDPPWWPGQEGQIKANRNSGKYHVPGSQFYAKTYDNVVCFDTEAEAEAAGYVRSNR
jgi:hypothetical protein